MSEAHGELLNVYDADGAVTGAMPRREAKRSGLAVGAVNVLLASADGEVLLQRRPPDKENGGRWDKSVGGHVAAGESFDETAVRETGEELFDDPASPRVVLAPDEAAYRARLDDPRPLDGVLFRRVSFQRNLRDVRRGPDGALRNVLYHVAVYLGRSDVPVGAFRPQASEIARLGYFGRRAVDLKLLRGELAPNMAFLWLTHAHALLAR
ncbi:MAG TPA: NUDIX domain-containing protein [Vicinamibacteria bacterium]|nr:NUDIX domain-containing protein [Vicinamibacteria bacterium]